MNAIADTSTAHPLGRVFGLSNEEYHAGPGVSKSQLDQIAESPATYIWAKNAPVDEEKLKAFDMGSAIHCLLLEPDEFKDRFIIAPPFNRRTNAGKAEEAEFLASCAELGKTVMDAEEGRKLYLMRDSVMAHPDARWLLEQEGHSEASFYWIDPPDPGAVPDPPRPPPEQSPHHDRREVGRRYGALRAPCRGLPLPRAGRHVLRRLPPGDGRGAGIRLSGGQHQCELWPLPGAGAPPDG